MSDYTPTTEEVRNVYDKNYRGFDRWLAQHDTEVAKATEARIIKLLENKAPNCNEVQYNFLGCDCSISYHDAIALIKGENK